MHPALRLPLVAFGVSLALAVTQLIGGLPGEFAATLALPLAGVLAFSVDWRYLPAILVLCYPMVGIPVAAEGTAPGSGGLFVDAVSFVVLGGVQMSAPLVVMLAAFTRLAIEMVAGRSSLGGIVHPLLLPLLMLAMIPALMGALQGQALGLNRWSQGVRAMLAVGGFFWGAMLVGRARASTARLSRQVLRIIGVGALLLALGLMRGMWVFLVVGLAAGALPYFLRRRRFVEAGASAASTVLAGVTITLTTAAAAAFALFCVVLAAPRARAIRRWLVRGAVFGACAASVLLIWVVRVLSGSTFVEVVSRDEGFMQYAIFKLMGDRGPLWLSAIQQITAGPYLVVPSGRSLRPEGFDFGGLVYTWEFGAHNALLELLRNVGLFSGAVGLLVIGVALWHAVRLLADTRDGALTAVCAGFLGVAVAGLTTGNYPVYDVGFFLWAIGGWIAAVRWREQVEREVAAAPALTRADGGG